MAYHKFIYGSLDGLSLADILFHIVFIVGR